MENKRELNPPKINIDPLRTPILYADAIRINSNENGFVLDVAQGIAGTDQAFVVARIGLSKEHAQRLAALIADNIKKQGELTTSKLKIIN